MLKQFKIITLAATCFGSRRNHHHGAVLCLAKTTKYGLSVHVGIDVVNVMAAYQLVVQACGSQWRQESARPGADSIYSHMHNCLAIKMRVVSFYCLRTVLSEYNS